MQRHQGPTKDMEDPGASIILFPTTSIYQTNFLVNKMEVASSKLHMYYNACINFEFGTANIYAYKVSQKDGYNFN